MRRSGKANVVVTALLLIMLYRFVLERQGSLLQQREQRILQAVTTKSD